MIEGSLIRINDDNEWKGLYGIVRYIIGEIAYIFCVQYPTTLYIARPENNICIIST